MRIAIIKLGARITWETDAAVGPGEAVSIAKALKQGGAEVTVITKILTKDTLHPSMSWCNILDTTTADALEQFDHLVVVNGNVNFFGGAEDEAQIANYKVINNFPGFVTYVMCDPELPLLQIWENVKGKPWGSKYEEQDINITRPDIRVLSQPFDTQAVKTRWEKKKGTAPIGKVFHFPMERFPLLNAWMIPNPQPTVDLLYGGTARGGRRIPNLFKWYVDLPDDISVEIFGKIDQSDFEKHPKYVPQVMSIPGTEISYRYPAFSGMVKYNQMLPKMNNSLAHLVTGDPSYEVLDIIPQRAMECIAAGNIVFVDAAMDKSRRIYPKGTAAYEFLYVSDQAELVERLRMIKADDTLRYTLIEEQKFATAFDAVAFCQSLVNTLRSRA